MAFVLERGADFSTTVVVIQGFVHIAIHFRSVVTSLHGVIYTMLSRVTLKRRVMRQVEKTLL